MTDSVGPGKLGPSCGPSMQQHPIDIRNAKYLYLQKKRILAQSNMYICMYELYECTKYALLHVLNIVRVVL